MAAAMADLACGQAADTDVWIAARLLRPAENQDRIKPAERKRV
jgi:hypothetical protein